MCIYTNTNTHVYICKHAINTNINQHILSVVIDMIQKIFYILNKGISFSLMNLKNATLSVPLWGLLTFSLPVFIPRIEVIHLLGNTVSDARLL